MNIVIDHPVSVVDVMITIIGDGLIYRYLPNSPNFTIGKMNKNGKCYLKH